MVKRSKVENLYNDLKKVELEEKKDKDKMIPVSFNIRAEDLKKLKQYAKDIAPGYFKISLSLLVRYMISAFDLEKAKREFFKI
jgi:hypothetical protein